MRTVVLHAALDDDEWNSRVQEESPQPVGGVHIHTGHPVAAGPHDRIPNQQIPSAGLALRPPPT